MKGALIELLARGEQDNLFLKKNPDINTYLNVYKKKSNKTYFNAQHTFNESPDFGKKITCKIENKGDLLTKCWLEISLPSTGETNVSWINSIGIYIIKEIKLLIGGVEVDKFGPEFIDAFYKHNVSLGRYATFTEMTQNISGFRSNSNTTSNLLILPLPFWFTKSLGDSLPLLCLQYMDVTVEIEFKNLNECLYNDSSNRPNLNLSMIDCKLFTKLIYLDSPERIALLRQPELNYLVEQRQYAVHTVNNNQKFHNINFLFNNPVKELLWIYRDNYHKNRNSWNIYTLNNGNDDELQPINFAELKFNGLDRTGKMSGSYFRLLEPFEHHTSTVSDYYYFYSFTENPEDMQPSSYVNMSLIDNTTLNIEYNDNINPGELFLYAIGYNYLRIKNGMGGLLYY